MTVDHVEVLVEEPSAEAALGVLLPRILGNVGVTVHAHQGKSDLLDKLPGKLRAYQRWLPPNHRVVVLVDRDSEDCFSLKERLEIFASNAGLPTRSRPHKGGYVVVNRIAVEELEAWFFGDWEAVATAFPKVDRRVPLQTKYRDPDDVAGGTWEALERVLQSAGYFPTGLRKIETARAVAANMVPERNTSRSFKAFQAALREMTLG